MEQLNIAGLTYGSLTALSYHDHKNNHPRWLFRCACGSILPIQKDQVVRGITEQCTACGHLVTAAKRTTHGRSKTSEYMTYQAARSRCNNPNDRRYADYGGRRFRFRSFEEFYATLGPRPTGLSLDRVNNNGNYAKGNVRWSTRKEQAANKRPKGPNRRHAIHKSDENYMPVTTAWHSVPLIDRTGNTGNAQQTLAI
jgi:hypothetical protein